MMTHTVGARLDIIFKQMISLTTGGLVTKAVEAIARIVNNEMLRSVRMKTLS